MSRMLSALMPEHVSKEIMETLFREGFVRNGNNFEFEFRKLGNEVKMIILASSPNVIKTIVNGVYKNFEFERNSVVSFDITYDKVLAHVSSTVDFRRISA